MTKEDLWVTWSQPNSFFWMLLETKQINKKENEASFGGAVARFVDGMWMNHAAKKTTYRDLRMEEGTPS